MKALTKQHDVGVIVGRFQVDDLHEGHREMLNHLNANHNRVIVFLGIPAMQYGSLNNPLDYQARLQMIQSEYPHFLILPLQDKRSDEEWSKTLDLLIGSVIIPGQSVLLYGGRDSFIPHYKGKYATRELETENEGRSKFLSGTEVRNKIKNTPVLDKSFRAGAIWQTFNRYAAVMPTVDIAIVNPATKEVLLAKKPGEHGWRFVGGFAEPNSPSFEHDAAREAREETGLELTACKYLGSFLIDDWRLSKEKDKIKTLFFVAEYIFGSPKAADDVCDLMWFDVRNAITVMPEHKQLLATLKQHLYPVSVSVSF